MDRQNCKTESDSMAAQHQHNFHHGSSSSEAPMKLAPMIYCAVIRIESTLLFDVNGMWQAHIAHHSMILKRYIVLCNVACKFDFTLLVLFYVSNGVGLHSFCREVHNPCWSILVQYIIVHHSMIRKQHVSLYIVLCNVACKFD